MLLDRDSDRRCELAAIRFTRQVLTSDDLTRLFWISGSTCAGKTSVSSAVAERLNFNVYHCDENEHSQGQRANPARHPNWFAYSRLTGDALWLQPVEQHLAHEERACAEQFELIVEDLAKSLRADCRPLIYDGYVSPYILAALLPRQSHAFYLVATDDFQRIFYKQRPWIKDVLAKTSNPELAWENWMRRDSMGARALEGKLRETGLDWILVDGTLPLDETVNRVAAHFARAQESVRGV